MSESSNPNNVKLGQVVESKIYGFKGIAVCYTIHLNGMMQFHVRLPSENNNVPELKIVDAPDLTHAKDKTLRDLEPQPLKWKDHIDLGDEVFSKTLDLKGVATELWFCISGVVKVHVGLKEKFCGDDYVIRFADSFEPTNKNKSKPRHKESGCMNINTFSNL